MHDDPMVSRIADALRRYGQRRPRAADSPRGIREWWLADFEPPPTAEQVAAALELLAQEGGFVRQLLADGSELWRPSAGPR